LNDLLIAEETTAHKLDAMPQVSSLSFRLSQADYAEFSWQKVRVIPPTSR